MIKHGNANISGFCDVVVSAFCLSSSRFASQLFSREKNSNDSSCVLLSKKSFYVQLQGGGGSIRLHLLFYIESRFIMAGHDTQTSSSFPRFIMGISHRSHLTVVSSYPLWRHLAICLVAVAFFIE